MKNAKTFICLLSLFSFLGCTEKWLLRKDTMIVNLNIADRNWDPGRPDKNVGWCAEASIQMAMSYYGIKISQRSINKAGAPKHADLYMDDIDVALKKLSIKYVPWNGNNRDLYDFLSWIRAMLDSHHPVLCGVKIYPDEKPRWFLDHFVLIVGYSEKGFLVNTNIYGQKLISYKQLTSLKNGFSFKNHQNHYFARAITGSKDSVPVFRVN